MMRSQLPSPRTIARRAIVVVANNGVIGDLSWPV